MKVLSCRFRLWCACGCQLCFCCSCFFFRQLVLMRFVARIAMLNERYELLSYKSPFRFECQSTHLHGVNILLSVLFTNFAILFLHCPSYPSVLTALTLIFFNPLETFFCSKLAPNDVEIADIVLTFSLLSRRSRGWSVRRGRRAEGWVGQRAAVLRCVKLLIRCKQ